MLYYKKGRCYMCTAISWNGKHHYFGRNLDLEYGYPASICITPRNYPFNFRYCPQLDRHYAMIGTAAIADGYPLYFEATNECGLSIAGLNFPGNAAYLPPVAGKDNISPFELIPWLLGQCADLEHAKKLLANVNLANIPFSEQYPLSPLHWLVSDSTGSIVLEAMADGLHIYDDPIGVLTNNPPFPYHQYNLANYMSLSPQQAENHFAPEAEIIPYSNGMGSIGLPGDFSSASRFVKAAFVKLNSGPCNTVEADVVHYFHMLQSVAMPRGSVIMPDGRCEITRYSCCCDTTAGIYYYTTYENMAISAVDLHKENLDSCELSTFPMLTATVINKQN